MDKRYQVFVSSTYKDLEEERQEVMHALLELDCIPSGMELFPAANESQWNLIKKVIEDCDYYILIVGGRYGSLSIDGLSYTEMEYRYAIQINKPIIAFIHRNPGKIIAEKTEQTSEGKEKLTIFRKEVEKRLCKEWETAQELGSVVSRSLIQLIKSTPAIGWVRATELPDRDATIELLQLRRTVEQLQAEINRIRISAPLGTENLSQGNDLMSLKYSFTTYNSSTDEKSSWISSYSIPWNDIFFSMAPLMINETNEDQLLANIDSLTKSKNLARLKKDKRFKENELSQFKVDRDCFQTIKIQFRALGLVIKSDKPRSVKDTDTYWTLTPYGDEIMTRLRAIKKEELIDQKNDPSEEIKSKI